MGLSRSRLEAALQVLSTVDQVPPLSPQAPLPFSFHLFETLPSTNEAAWKLVNQGAGAGTVAIAAQQQAGRGQWGRQWSSPRGGLYLSLVLDPKLAVEFSAQLTLASAWGIATLLRSQGIPVCLKWPNDLVLHGKKLAGILTETRVQQGRITKAVIGVGVNWTNPVPQAGINLKSYLNSQSHASVHSLEALAALILHGLALGYQFWQREGIGTLLANYSTLLLGLGQVITVNGRSGIVAGISPTGELQMQLQHPSETQSATTASGQLILLKPGTISLGYS